MIKNLLKFYEKKTLWKEKLVGLPTSKARLGDTDVRKCDITTTITVLTILQLWLIL
jgi:hypothetical protein